MRCPRVQRADEAAMSHLQDRIAIVTGGAQGLGAAICRRLAQEGAAVVVADIRLSGAEDVARAIVAETGRRALAENRTAPV